MVTCIGFVLGINLLFLIIDLLFLIIFDYAWFMARATLPFKRMTTAEKTSDTTMKISKTWGMNIIKNLRI